MHGPIVYSLKMSTAMTLLLVLVGGWTVILKFRYVFTFMVLTSVILTLYLKEISHIMSGRLLQGYFSKRNVSDDMHQTLQNMSLASFSDYDYKHGASDDPRFQQINAHDAWVFSAFHDTIQSLKLIRVFGIQRLSLTDPVYCHVLNNGSTFVIEGKRTLLTDNHGRKFRVVSYECKIDPYDHPESVSLTFNKRDIPTNKVTVFYSLPFVRNFTVCYASLYNFSDPMQIIQNVEFNRVLGAKHFFVYNHTISDNVDTVLRHYLKQGLMTVIQWPIPITQIHYNGQILAINDCVYRNKGASKYVVVQDSDEFIIPYQHDNWNDLISQINADYDSANSKHALSHENVGTYIVESTFFQEFPNLSEWVGIKHNYSISEEEEDFFIKHSMTVFTKLKRLDNTFGQARQKSFVRPELVLFPDVHTTITHRPLARDVMVDQKMALVHHVRFFESKSNHKLETTSLRFKNKFVSLVRWTLNMLSLNETKTSFSKTALK